MRVLSTNYKTWKNQLRGNKAFVWLLELWRDATNVSRYCRERANVTFGGNTYTRKEFSIEPPRSDVQGTFHDFSVQMGAADQVETAYLMNDKYIDQPMVARLVNLADLSSEDDQLVFRGKIKSAVANEKQAVLRCGPNNLHKATIPREILMAQRCRFRFKDWQCAYVGGETTCNLTPTDCEDNKTNLDRYGGAPSIPVFNS